MKTKMSFLFTLLFFIRLTSFEAPALNAIPRYLPINTQINGDLLTVVSSGGSGNIKRLQVRQGSTVLLTQNCPNTNTCTINISSLSPGNYTVVAYCTNATLEQPFSF